jgi:ribosomal protein S18 acetylase RimI-like enzyme
MNLMDCSYCDQDAVYKCNVCGKPICMKHMSLRTVCISCTKESILEYTIDKATSDKDRGSIRDLVRRFWGEQEQLTFDKMFIAAELPAYIARVGDEIRGFLSFAETEDDVIIVTLGILPEYQNSGIGRSLIEKVEAEARSLGKPRLRVSTSNDDLPALAFYQSVGFQIYEVKPDVIAEKHGRVLEGIGGLPVRDELRLRKTLYRSLK